MDRSRREFLRKFLKVGAATSVLSAGIGKAYGASKKKNLADLKQSTVFQDQLDQLKELYQGLDKRQQMLIRLVGLTLGVDLVLLV